MWASQISSCNFFCRFLLHHVVWQSKETFSTIYSKYVDYIKQLYNNLASTKIVVYRHPDEASKKGTKSAEQLHRK